MRRVKLLPLSLLFLSLLFTPQTVFPLDVPLTIKNRESTAKPAEPVTSGVPFARGVIADISLVRIVSGDTEIPAQFMTTARWPDGSIRWLLSDFQTDLPASGETHVTLQTGTPRSSVSGITVQQNDSTVTVNTGAAAFSFNKNELVLGGSYFEVTHSGTTYRAVPDAGSWAVEEQGPLKVMLRAEGNWYSGSSLLRDSLIRFKARLVFYRNHSTVRAYFTFQNNNAYAWDYEIGAGPPPLELSAARFGATTLLPSGTYRFGAGVEKTWELLIPAEGSASVRESRYNSDGTLASGYSQPRPIAAASPSYYASTKAFGRVSPPPTVTDAGLQADLDLYEKIQRGKVRYSDLQNPPGKEGITIWGHMHQDIDNWNHYGGLRWGGDFGPVSDNHYDWVYGMYLQFMRTGLLDFADAARVFAKHELDFAIYHTGADGQAYNYQKNWESRPSDDGPENEFGGGRPSHTWLQGYALHWLLTGDPRGKDGYQELGEGIRQYVYESFNGEGYINTREIRIQGWLTENLVTLWRIDPEMAFETGSYGTKSIPAAVKDVLASVLHFEAADGSGGYVYVGEDPDPDTNMRQPLMNCYFLEPAIEAYEELFSDSDPDYASQLFGLITRMTDWLISVTYGGTTNSRGQYLPGQIPYMVDIRLSSQTEGQPPYILMAANAASFIYLKSGNPSYRSYARNSFRDYVRYIGVADGDSYIDPHERTAASYNSSVYVDTESKVQGWGNRYGQFYLESEQTGAPPRDTVPPEVRILRPKNNARVNARFTVKGTASDNLGLVRLEYRFGTGRWLRKAALASWSIRAPRSIRHRTVKFAIRARDTSGNTSRPATRKFRVR